MVPKRSPWVHTASAQPATMRLISSGRASVVRSMSTSAGELAAEQQVADDAADEVERCAAAAAKRSASGRTSSRMGCSRAGITGDDATAAPADALHPLASVGQHLAAHDPHHGLGVGARGQHPGGGEHGLARREVREQGVAAVGVELGEHVVEQQHRRRARRRR